MWEFLGEHSAFRDAEYTHYNKILIHPLAQKYTYEKQQISYFF